VIGIGNPLRGDDAAGLAVASALGAEAFAGEPIGLIDAWAGAGTVVVVDAMRSGAPPGTVVRADAGDGPLPTAFSPAVSSHAIDLVAVIELARELGRLPAGLEVIGIEGGTFATGVGLSPAVERAVAEVAQDLAQRKVLR